MIQGSLEHVSPILANQNKGKEHSYDYQVCQLFCVFYCYYVLQIKRLTLVVSRVMMEIYYI